MCEPHDYNCYCSVYKYSEEQCCVTNDNRNLLREKCIVCLCDEGGNKKKEKCRKTCCMNTKNNTKMEKEKDENVLKESLYDEAFFDKKKYIT